MEKKKNTLKSLKPFGTTCSELTKPKFNFSVTIKEGIFWRKMGDAYVEKNTIMLCGCVAAGGIGNNV